MDSFTGSSMLSLGSSLTTAFSVDETPSSALLATKVVAAVGRDMDDLVASVELSGTSGFCSTRTATEAADAAGAITGTDTSEVVRGDFDALSTSLAPAPVSGVTAAPEIAATVATGDS